MRDMAPTYLWRAVYTDGSALDEYDDATPGGHGFAEVDLERCARFALVGTDPAQPTHEVEIKLERGERAVFFRRHRIGLSLMGEELSRSVVHCIGVGRGGPEGVVPLVFCFVWDDGSVLVTMDQGAV